MASAVAFCGGGVRALILSRTRGGGGGGGGGVAMRGAARSLFHAWRGGGGGATPGALPVSVSASRPRGTRPFTRPATVVMASWRMGGGGGGADTDASKFDTDAFKSSAAPSRDAREDREERYDRPSRGRRYSDDEPGDYDDDERPQRGGGGERERGGGERGRPSRGRGDRDGGRGRGTSERPGFRGRGDRDGGERMSARGRGGRGDRGDRRYDNGGGGGGGYGDDDEPRERSVWQERHDVKKQTRSEPTLAERVLGEAIYGANPVRAALLAKRRTVHHVWVQEEAGGISRTSTRPTLNLLLLLRAYARAFTLKVSRAPMSVECVFSMTLLRGRRRGPGDPRRGPGVGRGGGAEEQARSEHADGQPAAPAQRRHHRRLAAGPRSHGFPPGMVGTHGYFSPRHMMPFNSRNEGSKCV